MEGADMDWGDVLAGETVQAQEKLPPPEEYGPDEDGVRTVIEYRWAGEGASRRKEKIIKKIKRVERERRVPLAAQRRREIMKPFGAAAEQQSENVTYPSYDAVYIEKPGEEQEDAMAEKLEATLKNAFWRRAQRQHAQKLMEQAGIEMGSVNLEESAAAISQAGATGKYQPPGKKRVAFGGAAAAEEDQWEEDTTVLKISNLSPEADEDDLRELCRRFGGISRVHIAKDHDTGESRGFGFVTFHLKGDAERARQSLNGFGYDHLILKVDWARQRKRDPGMEGGLSGRFVSGYGKALPQMPGMGR